MSDYCFWHEISYEQAECPKCALAIWKSRRLGGWLIVCFTWPLCVSGLVLGVLWSALASGFKSTRNLWDEVLRYIEAERPGRRES
jgi:hypothetical protein